MAKGPATKRVVKRHVRRPGVHAKCKQSPNKKATNYVKPYVGQGR